MAILNWGGQPDLTVEEKIENAIEEAEQAYEVEEEVEKEAEALKSPFRGFGG